MGLREGAGHGDSRDTQVTDDRLLRVGAAGLVRGARPRRLRRCSESAGALRPHWVRRYVRFRGLRVREFHRIREHGQELAGLARVVVLRIRSEEIDDGQTVSGVERGAARRVS
jgi:hypothetical protein